MGVPAEVWVAILSLSGILIGFFLRPIGEFIGDALRRRQATSDRRQTFRFDTLIALQDALEVMLTAGTVYSPQDGTQAAGRVDSLAFRVKDDRLRELLELLLATDKQSTEWRDTYGNVTRRLGEVVRNL